MEFPGIAPPALASLCEHHVGSVWRSIARAIADCVEKTKELDERKTTLLLELATVSDALEDVSCCRQQLEQSRESMLDEIYAWMDDDKALALIERLEATPPPPQPPTPPEATLRGAPSTATKPSKRTKKVAAAATAAPGGRASETERAARRDAALPAEAAERAALLERQVLVRGLPPGRVDEAGLMRLLNALFDALPAYGPVSASAMARALYTTPSPSGDACTRVQIYAGGTYAFATLRDRALAATGEALSPLPLGTALVELRRNFGYEGVGTAEALASSLLPIPPSLDVAALVASVHWQSAKRVPLEEKLYWALRQHGQHPKPNEKEVHEALAFFKKTEKLLGRRRLVLDVCGSHGLLGSLFVAFGRAERAVVLDLFQPASFGNLCDACRPWLEVPDRHAMLTTVPISSPQVRRVAAVAGGARGALLCCG